jgi:hypothetical protein
MTRLPSDPEIILILPRPERVGAVLKCGAGPVRCFSSVAEFEAWQAQVPVGGCFANLVDLLVDECAPGEVPPQLQVALSWLRQQPCVPPLKVFSEAVCPRRSFFRAWSRAMNQRPATFLSHLRALHAESLLSHGETVDAALRATGCRSLPALRRLLDRWH